MTEVIYALCGLSLLQCLGIALLMKRRRDPDQSRIEARLTHFGEALALLTETTQSGFATVAAELTRAGARRGPAVNRAATSKRIVTAARKGRSIQDIAADEDVSESEVRLHLGLADDAATSGLSAPAVKPHAVTIAVPAAAKAVAPSVRPAAASPRPGAASARLAAGVVKAGPTTRRPAAAPVAVVHDVAGRAKGADRRRGNILDLGA